MIRAYRKKPVKIRGIDYQKLLVLTIKEKYFSLFLGLLASFIISSLTYKVMLKNVRINLAFKIPSVWIKSKLANLVKNYKFHLFLPKPDC